MRQRFGRLSLDKRLGLVVALVLALGGIVLAVAGAAPKPKVPVPSLQSSENNPTTSTSISFTFSDSQAGVSFKCSKDGSAFTICHSPQPYSGLVLGNHTFSVQAISGSNASGNASFAWAVVPPTPTITGHPANPTSATSATFDYTDSASGAGFLCSFDGSKFKSCPASGISYSRLGGGNHTFQVEARVGSTQPSAPASFSWLIDQAAPTITITFPANGGSYNAAGWSGGCSPEGICGTASDPSNVSSVAVALRQLSSGKYWNGGSFSSNAIVFTNAAGTTAWEFAKTLPPDGAYTVSAKATDSFGNTTASKKYTTATFTIDTAAPPAPVLIEKPSNPSKDKSPEFEFTDRKNPVVFTCTLDSGAPVICTGDTDHDGDNHGEHNKHNDTSTFGEWEYHNLTPGPHCFSVFATDAAGNVGPTTAYCWTISGTATASHIVVVSGSPQNATAGGTFAAPLVAKVTDASNNPIAGVTVTFTAPASGASGSFAAAGCITNSPTRTCSVTTNASGLATSSAFTAGTTTGSYTVAATATGVATPANFLLTNAPSVAFHVSGNASTPFYPGLTQKMNLLVTNPNASPLTVPVGGITISIDTGTAACPPFSTTPPNFSVTSNGASFVIPGGTTSPVTLTSLGLSNANLPTITMNNTPFDQQGCKSLSLTLHYTGTGSGS